MTEANQQQTKALVLGGGSRGIGFSIYESPSSIEPLYGSDKSDPYMYLAATQVWALSRRWIKRWPLLDQAHGFGDGPV